MTFVRAPFGDLATAAASSDRMPSGARVAGAASSRSSAFSCCRWQREPHRRKALLRSLHPRSTATVVEAGLLERAKANPKQMFRVIVQSATSAKAAESAFDDAEKADDQQLQDDEKLAEDNEQLADKAYSKFKTKADRARASAERDRWHAKREEAKALRKTARGELDDRFDFINGVSLEISGRRLERLARIGGLIITEDVEVQQQVSCRRFRRSQPTTWPHRPSSCGRTSPESASSGRTPPGTCRRSRSSTRGSIRPCPTLRVAYIPQLNFVGSGKPNGCRDGRGHGTLRCRHRGRLGDGLRRRGTERSAHLARRHGRLRLRSDE